MIAIFPILDVTTMESFQFPVKAQYSKTQHIAMVFMYPINHWYSFKGAINDLDRRSYRCSKFKTSGEHFHGSNMHYSTWMKN